MHERKHNFEISKKCAMLTKFHLFIALYGISKIAISNHMAPLITLIWVFEKQN